MPGGMKVAPTVELALGRKHALRIVRRRRKSQSYLASRSVRLPGLPVVLVEADLVIGTLIFAPSYAHLTPSCLAPRLQR